MKRIIKTEIAFILNDLDIDFFPNIVKSNLKKKIYYMMPVGIETF